MFLEKFYATMNQLAAFILNLSPEWNAQADGQFLVILVAIIFFGCLYFLLNEAEKKNNRQKNDFTNIPQE